MKTFASYHAEWEKNAKQDPYWAILTSPDGQWDPQDFFSTGTHEIKCLLEYLHQQSIPFFPHGMALDFGCGIGRVTRALSPFFDKTIGVDIASNMIQEAINTNKKYHSIEFICNPQPNLKIFKNEQFDFIYSNIVFQHINKKQQLIYLKEFSRILKRNGWAIVQIPSRRIYKHMPAWIKGHMASLLPYKMKKFILKSWMNNNNRAVTEFNIEMNPIKQQSIIKKATSYGLEIKQVSYTNSTQPEFCGNLIFMSREEAEKKAGFLSPMYFLQKT